MTPVTCPHCGRINYALVSLRASEALSYRALVERPDRYRCQACSEPFVVVYASEPGEADQPAAVRCPRCHWVNYASVARSAVADFDAWYLVEEGPSEGARPREARGGSRLT